jgi:hypothetical protein
LDTKNEKKPWKLINLLFSGLYFNYAESQGFFPNIKNVDFAQKSKHYGGGLKKVSNNFKT